MRDLLKFLVGLTFAVRSLLPVGFMLAVAPDHAGSVSIVICTGHGPQSLALDHDGAPLQKKSASNNNICPYSSAGAVAINAAAPQLLAQVVRYASITHRITSDIFHRTPTPGATSARGPPATLV
jgi:hypothetical protein